MKKSTLIISTVLSIVIFAGLVGYRIKERKKQQEEISNTKPPVTAVSVVKPQKGTISDTFSTTGVIVSQSDVQVIPKVGGKIISLFVDEGSKVNSGDIIAQIEHNELDAQLLQAKAQLSITKANLDMMVNGPLNTQITQAQASVRQAESSLAQIKVNREHSQTDFDRFKKLQAQGAITNQQLENYSAQLEGLKRQYEAGQQQLISAKAALKNLKDGTRPEQISGGRGQIEQAKASIQILESQLSNYTIKAPISGVVTKRNLVQGSMASMSSSIVTISKTDSPEIEMNIPEKQILKVKLNQEVNLESSAFPDKKIKITIKEISPIVDSQTRLIKVKGAIESDLPLKIGMMFDCKILLRQESDSLILPSEAVLTDLEKKFVYVAVNNKVQEKKIKVGLQNTEEIQVLEGLTPEDNVITKGNVFVKAGDNIQIEAPVAVVKVD